MSDHLAVYGVTKIKRSFCNKCKDYAFVIDKTFTCCYEPYTENVSKFKVMTQSMIIRKKPSVDVQRRLLLAQGNKCKYCKITFGELYFRDGKPKISRIHYDHLVPYSYQNHCPDNNWVAACNVCNLIKGNKIFNTIEEVKDYVIYNRRKKNIYYNSEELPQLQKENEQTT